jgi:AcrR family transcriptional regulator
MNAQLVARRRRPSQERAKVTVDALIEATFQVLDRVGFDGLTTTRVADRAGVSVGSLYQYFSDRDALLVAAGRRHMECLQAKLEQAALEHAELGERVRAMLSVLVDFALARPRLSRELIQLVRTRKEGRAVFDVALADLGKLFDETVMRPARLGKDDAQASQVTAHALAGVLEALGATEFEGFDRETLIPVLERLVHGAVGWVTASSDTR